MLTSRSMLTSNTAAGAGTISCPFHLRRAPWRTCAALRKHEKTPTHEISTLNLSSIWCGSRTTSGSPRSATKFINVFYRELINSDTAIADLVRNEDCHPSVPPNSSPFFKSQFINSDIAIADLVQERGLLRSKPRGHDTRVRRPRHEPALLGGPRRALPRLLHALQQALARSASQLRGRQALLRAHSRGARWRQVGRAAGRPGGGRATCCAVLRGPQEAVQLLVAQGDRPVQPARAQGRPHVALHHLLVRCYASGLCLALFGNGPLCVQAIVLLEVALAVPGSTQNGMS